MLQSMLVGTVQWHIDHAMAYRYLVWTLQLILLLLEHIVRYSKDNLKIEKFVILEETSVLIF